MNIFTGYYKVLYKLDDITKTLQLNHCARDELRRLYQRKQWLDIAARPAEGELVILALERIKQDPSQFYLFIEMLRDIPEMDLIVTTLTGGELKCTYRGRDSMSKVEGLGNRGVGGQNYQSIYILHLTN